MTALAFETPAPASEPGPETLTGSQRAAVLLLLLGDKYGGTIWSMLDEAEIKKVSSAMAQLGSISAATVERLMIDFLSHLSGSGGIIGSPDRTEGLLRKMFPADRVAAIMAEIRLASGRRMWQRLPQIEPEVLASFLRNEYPQTVAVILSRMSPEHAARVVAILPDAFAVEVLNRMLRLESVQKEALEHIEETLHNEFVTAVAESTRRDPHEIMADVFHAFDRQTEARLLAALDETNREASAKIRALMFTFEDLPKLDAASIQTLMRGIDRDTLARALKGAPETIRAFFLSNMSTRAAKILLGEMADMGPIRLKEVDEAQTSMVNLARELADKGEIMTAKHRNDEELVF